MNKENIKKAIKNARIEYESKTQEEKTNIFDKNYFAYSKTEKHYYQLS